MMLFWPMILSSDSCQKGPKDSQPLIMIIMILIKKSVTVKINNRYVVTIKTKNSAWGTTGYWQSYFVTKLTYMYKNLIFSTYRLIMINYKYL